MFGNDGSVEAGIKIQRDGAWGYVCTVANRLEIMLGDCGGNPDFNSNCDYGTPPIHAGVKAIILKSITPPYGPGFPP